VIDYGTDYTCHHGEQPGDCPGCDPYNIDVAHEPHTDLGNAKRLVAAHGKQLRYIPPWKKWLLWDGMRWARDVTMQHARHAKEIARGITEQARGMPDGEAKKAMLNAARRAESAPGIRGMLELAGTELGVVLDPVELDADPDVLNTQTGVLDLETGVLWPHQESRNLTKVTAAGYDQHAEAPEFHRFLERIQPDPEMRAFLARLLGHALSGRVHEHVLPIFHGVGANGKSTLVEVCRKVLGDYAASVDPGLLIDRGEQHPTGVADLFGLRLALTHESDQGRRLAEGTIKRLTGGDAITARRMREDFWTFDPTHSLIMVTNHAPVVTGNDEGIWRRLRIVPFSVVIPTEERDSELPERIYKERDGILRWLYEGYQAYRVHGLDEPESVTKATNDYRDGSDMIGLFISEKCHIGNAMFQVKSSSLFDAWSAWCTSENIPAGTNKAFSTAIESRGFDKKPKSTGNWWQGIGLQDDGTAP
jgi:putative DNA primase/helicase